MTEPDGDIGVTPAMLLADSLESGRTGNQGSKALRTRQE
jgi:hypothetical protein